MLIARGLSGYISSFQPRPLSPLYACPFRVVVARSIGVKRQLKEESRSTSGALWRQKAQYKRSRDVRRYKLNLNWVTPLSIQLFNYCQEANQISLLLVFLLLLFFFCRRRRCCCCFLFLCLVWFCYNNNCLFAIFKEK